MTQPDTRQWTDIPPADATELDLSKDLTITAPLNENGERCPWPWEPQQLVGAPIGQYRCGFCGAEYPGDDNFVGQLCGLPKEHFGEHRCEEGFAGTGYTATLRWPNGAQQQ